MTTAIDYTARVQAGAQLLDEQAPGWEERIDLDTLDVSLHDRCVLAQSVGDGDYCDALDALDLHEEHDVEEDAVDYGFIISHRESAQVFPLLTAAWRDLITARRAAAK